MSQNATAIKSIKFYCSVPKLSAGQVSNYEVKSTFHAPLGSEPMSYSVDTGASGTLTVTIGGVVYIYKLADILGRIEIQQ